MNHSAQDKPNHDHRTLAAQLFNDSWTIMDLETRTSEQVDAMIHTAHASAYHWLQAGNLINQARSHWQISRVYVVANRPEPARYHAHRCLEYCQQADAEDWDLAYAYEALARACCLHENTELTQQYINQALSIPISEKENRELLESDIATICTPS